MTAHLKRADAVAVVTIDNPPVNVIDAPTRRDLHAILDELETDPDLRAVVLTGAGDRAFCAGADMREEAELQPETVRQFLAEDNGVYDRLEALPVPSVAAVFGACMGGGFELALACDLRVVAPDAKFCAAGVKVGLVVSTTRLVRLIGLARASDIVLTGRNIAGTEAVQLGLATQIASEPGPDAVRTLGSEVAQLIATRAPLAVRRAKQSLAEAVDLPYPAAMATELDHFVALSATKDHKHALDAFFRRVRPEFRGC